MGRIKRLLNSSKKGLTESWQNDALWRKLFLVAGVLLISTVLLLGFTWPPHHLAQVQDARNQLQSAIDDLKSLQQPQLIEIGQRDTTLKFQTDELTRLVADDIKPLSLPPAWTVTINNWRSPIKLPQDYQYASIASRYADAVQELNELYSYHLGVLFALTPVYELNPVATYSFIDPSNDLSILGAQEVIEDLSGISSQIERLSDNSSINDDLIDDALGVINKLSQTYTAFTESKRLDSLEGDVKLLQDELVTNRQLFWEQAIENTGQKLGQVDVEIASYEATLNALAN